MQNTESDSLLDFFVLASCLSPFNGQDASTKNLTLFDPMKCEDS